MKNTFKFLSIALLACGMMTACGGDDPETPENPDNPSTNGEPSVSIKFKNADLGTFNDNTATWYSAYQTMTFGFAKQGQDMPFIEFYTTVVTTNGTGTGYLEGQEPRGEVTYFEYYEQYALTQQYNDGREVQRGDWWAETSTIKCDAYDLTAAKASYTLEGNMFSALQAFVPDYGQVGIDAADHGNMSVVVKNYPFTTNNQQ